MSTRDQSYQPFNPVRMYKEEHHRFSHFPHPRNYDENTDSRQDERLLDGFSAISVSRDNDGEGIVFLSPRVDPSFECSKSDLLDDDALLLRGSLSSTTLSPTVNISYLRQQSCPSIPNSDDSPMKSLKPVLCRSFAWSQDSSDERRISKRCRLDVSKEPTEDLQPLSLSDAFPFNGFAQQHHNQNQIQNIPELPSPTFIHWEEKVVDSMDLSTVIRQSIKVSTPSDMKTP